MTPQPLADPSLRAAVRAARQRLELADPPTVDPVTVGGHYRTTDGSRTFVWWDEYGRMHSRIEEPSAAMVGETIARARAVARPDLADELERLADAIAFPWREVTP